MNFAFTPEQELLRRTAREVLANAASLSIAHVRALNRRPGDEDGGPTHFSAGASLDDTSLWSQLADLGFLGLPFCATHGGSEGSFLDLAVVLEEMGRAVGPPAYTHTVALAGLALRDHGSTEQKDRWIPGIVSGRVRLATALEGEIILTGTASGLRLRGVAPHVEEAGRSDAWLVGARGPGAVASLVLVPSGTAGTTLQPHRTVAGGDRASIYFDDVTVAPEQCLGDPGAADPVEELRQRAVVATCLDMLGGAAAVLEMAVAYAGEREQFGRKIGSFQAVQHHAADMAVDVEACTLVTYQAAWRLSEGLDARLEAAMAKAWCGEAYRRVCTLGHQIFGGIGLMREHDMHLFLRRSRRDDLLFGDAAEHLDRIAAVLDEVDTPWPELRGFSLPGHPT